MEFSKFDEYIGDRLYCERVTKRLTQGYMAKSISNKMKANGHTKGISRQAYAFYEKGERGVMKDDK